MPDTDSPLSAEETGALNSVLEVIETVARSPIDDFMGNPPHEFMDNRVGGFLAALATVDPPLTVVRLDRARDAGDAGGTGLADRIKAAWPREKGLDLAVWHPEDLIARLANTGSDSDGR